MWAYDRGIPNMQSRSQFRSTSVPVLLWLVVIPFIQGVEFHRNTLFVNGYWIDHWLLDYSHGFVRRGFWGTFLNLMGGWQHNILFVNLLALLVALLIISVLLRQLMRAFPVTDAVSLAFIAAFILSPLTSLFFECLGDPVQLTVLMALGAIPLLSREAYPLFWRAAIAIGVMTVSMLIHEASLFTSGPVFVWLLAGPATRGVSLKNVSFAKAAAILSLVAIVIATVYVIDSRGTITAEKRASLLPRMVTQAEIVPLHYHTEADSLLMMSIKAEYDEGGPFSPPALMDGCSYCGWAPGRWLFPIEKFVRVFAIPFLFCNLLLWTCAYHGTGAHEGLSRRFLQMVILGFACSVPLYFVAADWGRFSIYTVCLSLYAAGVSAGVAGVRDSDAGPLMGSALSRRVLYLFVLILMIYPIHRFYRVSGLTYPALLCFLFVLPAVLGMRWRTGWVPNKID